MISHKFKCIFIHVPKVAGQSIETFFLDQHKLSWDTREPLLLRFNDNGKVGPPRLAHLKVHEYLEFQYVSKEMFQNYFKFAFIRNPWSRAVSFYKYSDYDKFISFDSFVEKELPFLLKTKRWFYGQQYDFLYHNNKLMVDFIGRYENLQSDFSKVCEKLNLKNKSLPHVNNSENREPLQILRAAYRKIKNNPKILGYLGKDKIKSNDYKDYYINSSLIEQINELYQQDIASFNYTFD